MTLSPRLQQRDTFPIRNSRSLLRPPTQPPPFPCTAVVYGCIHLSLAWGGDPVAADCERYVSVMQFGLLRTRVSEQPLFVDTSLTPGLLLMRGEEGRGGERGDSLVQAGRKGQNRQASQFNRCDSTARLN